MLLFLFFIGICLGTGGCSIGQERDLRLGDGTEAADAAVVRAPLTEEERSFYLETAEVAWSYIERNYQESTGLVNATPTWPYATIWDIGSQLLAFHAAKELELLDSAEFDRRMSTTLRTLERVDLFRDLAYDKAYSTRDASMGTSTRSAGSGWSATDLGRFLVALRVIAVREPHYAAQAERIARRIRFDEVVRNGYLHGQLIGTRTRRPWTFQEGRIGYEQYAAAGFDLWGADVGNALNVRRNAQSVDVLGVRLLRDRRWQDRLVSEPFLLLALELGLPPDVDQLAAAVLAAQEARYTATGQITIATEDAVGLPPHYFYYYCVYCNGKPFVIGVASPGKDLEWPRWVSTKGAFAWHAIMPSEYTRKALEYVAPARHPTHGWASGVYEGTRTSTHTYDLNTAAVLLEVALFQLRGGRPLIAEPAMASTD